jgi:hypothetical protein
VEKLSYRNSTVSWKTPVLSDPMQQSHFYAVYRFPEGVEQDISNPAYLLKLVKEPYYKPITDKSDKRRYYYVVTTIDRCWNESEPGEALRVRH